MIDSLKDLKKLAGLLKQVPENIYWKDQQSVYQGCSDSFARLAGFDSAEAAIGKRDEDCTWAISAQQFQQRDAFVMQTQQTMTYHETITLQSHEVIFMRTTKSPLKDDAGRVIGVIGVSAVLSDWGETYEALTHTLAQKEAAYARAMAYLRDWYKHLSGEATPITLSAEQLVKKIQHYTDYILNQLPINVFWADRHGDVLGINTHLFETLCEQGQPEPSLEHFIKHHHDHKSMNVFLQEESLENILRNNEIVMRGDTTQAFEERVIDQTGQEHVFLSYKTPIMDDEQQKIGLLGVSIDITDRKIMEQELKLNKEKIERAYLAKLQFLRNMRHDVRTPLSCIVGSIRILKKMEPEGEQAEFLQGILNASEMLLNMLTRMLEHDHGQSDECPIELNAVNVQKFFQDLINLMEPLAVPRGLELRFSRTEKVPAEIITDTYRMNRIFLNLVTNAIKFTHIGSVSIELDTLGEHYIRVKIMDTGIGIPKQKQNMIFEPFVRLSESDQTSYEGEGLGLSIVRMFVEDLGGSIELISEEGKGSTFVVLLPIDSRSN